MATNTLGEWSDGEDDWIFEIDESTFLPQNIPTNTLGEWSDGEDDWIFDIDESTFLPQNIPTNTLDEFSDGEDVCIYENNEGVRNNSEEDDDLIRSINEDKVLNQAGRGEKRKSDDQDEEPRQDYYHIKSPKNHHSKKFGMTTTDHTVQFNNGLHDVDLLKSQERIHDIFQHLLEDVTKGMNPNDQVRFILRSDQLQTPIAIPFLPLEKLTTEKVLSHVEKVIQSNEEFR